MIVPGPRIVWFEYQTIKCENIVEKRWEKIFFHIIQIVMGYKMAASDKMAAKV